MVNEFIDYFCWKRIMERRRREPKLEWEPTDEEVCEGHGHPYYGDDEVGGRCYCGEVRYPEGGPEEEK